MNKLFIIIFAFLLFCGILTATNHLDIMTSMQGAHNTSYFGSTMATLDFNHDGFDDLIVCSPGWKSDFPSGWIMGKVDIYFGGPNFDNIPDIIMEGQYDFQYHSVVNIGDVNGDGFDDLYIGGDEPTSNPSVYYLRIYAGGSTVPIEPDILIPYTLDQGANLRKVSRLGDFNADGKDDIGFSSSSSSPGESYYIVWGGSFVFQYVTTSALHSESYPSGFNGIGDINGDGYDDFTIGYTNDDPYIGYHLITLYYGNADSLLTDTMVLAQTQAGISKISTSLGDMNGDGIADFMGYESGAGLNVWLGATETNELPNLALNPSWQGGESGRSLKYGDLNHDGYDDVVGADYDINQFRIWMGRIHPNGNSDLLVYAPYNLNEDIDNFGYGITMGDYNRDGCCDIAVSAPFTDDSMAHDYRGYVYVYAGNTQLADTTVGINDPLSPPLTNQFNMSISISPNPIKSNDRFVTIKLNDSNHNNISPIDISIYNIRGQKVKSFIMNAEQAKSGSATYNLNDLSSGVYVCVFTSGEAQQKQKITVIR